MIHKLIKFKAKKENLEEVIELIKHFLDNILENEPDTLYYESIQDEDQFSFIHIITFSNDEARKHHESTPYVKEFVEHLYPLLEAEPIFSDYKVIRSIKRY
jgi:quinol monooxygenase YgiN